MSSARCPEDRNAVVMNGHVWKNISLPIKPRLRPDLAARVGSLSYHGRISVGSHSGESGESGCCRNRFGAFFVTRKIQIRLYSDWERENRDRFGLKQLNRDASVTISEYCRDQINIFTNLWIFLPTIKRSWYDFWQILIRSCRIKVGSKNRECVTEALR